MTTDIIGRFGGEFTCRVFPHAMFYEFEIGLRFELADDFVSGRMPIKRFIQAFERARKISASLFGNANSLWVLVATYGDDKPDKGRLKPFEFCDIGSDKFQYLGSVAHCDSDHVESFGSDVYRHWDALKLDGYDRLDEVLWLALGRELGLQPSVMSEIYIVDFENSVALHPYDDRGMDVVAMDVNVLKVLYAEYYSWLLKYDLKRMQTTFDK